MLVAQPASSDDFLGYFTDANGKYTGKSSALAGCATSIKLSIIKYLIMFYQSFNALIIMTDFDIKSANKICPKTTLVHFLIVIPAKTSSLSTRNTSKGWYFGK